MKFRSIELTSPKPNVYALSAIDGPAPVVLLLWNSKIVRVNLDGITSKGHVISINSASDSFKLGVNVARIGSKIKLVHNGVRIPADGVMQLQREAAVAPVAPTETPAAE